MFLHTASAFNLLGTPRRDRLSASVDVDHWTRQKLSTMDLQKPRPCKRHIYVKTQWRANDYSSSYLSSLFAVEVMQWDFTCGGLPEVQAGDS